MDTISSSLHSSQAQIGHNNDQRIEKLAANTAKVLFRTKAVFPFDLFPDEVVVDLNKVNVIYREFFFVEQVYPILIRNIEGVVVESSIFFATLRIEVTRFIDAPFRIQYLKNEQAYHAKRIITGLVTCTKEGVDPATLSSKYLIDKIEEIGSGAE